MIYTGLKVNCDYNERARRRLRLYNSLINNRLTLIVYEMTIVAPAPILLRFVRNYHFPTDIFLYTTIITIIY